METEFGYSYNPAGIEQSFFFSEFKKDIPQAAKLANERLQMQFDEHLDAETSLMNRNTEDPRVLELRIYEAARLLL